MNPVGDITFVFWAKRRKIALDNLNVVFQGTKSNSAKQAIARKSFQHVMTSMPARLAKRTGCALIPACCLRLSAGQYSIELEEPLEFEADDKSWERSMTVRLNKSLEQKIRTYPEQWTWGHRRWKDQGPQIRNA